MSLLFRLQRVSHLARITHHGASHSIFATSQLRCSNAAAAAATSGKKKKKKKKSDSIDTSTSTTIASSVSAASESVSSTSGSTSSATPSAATSAVETTTSSGSSRSDWWRMKLYKIKRAALIFGIPLTITTGLFSLHESDLPYAYCLKHLAKYPLPDDYDPSLYEVGSDNPPPNPAPGWAQMIPMMWASQFVAWKPMKIMKQWNLFMPLLDEKYPAETRMVAVACLMGMLGGDSSTLPPLVFFDKCMRKREILKGYKGSDSDGNWTTERFLNAVYALCGETKNQQLLFAGIQLLLDLTSIPPSAREEDVDFIMKQCHDVPTMKADIARSLLMIYQDPSYIIEFVHRDPPRPRQPAMLPDFMELKRILMDHDAMTLCFNMMDSKWPQLKQMAMMILIGLVGNYPDIDEIRSRLGDTDDEKLQNGIKLVDALSGMGMEHFMRGENEAALGAFTEAMKFYRLSHVLRYYAGKCLSELGRIEEAKNSFRNAMTLTPKTMDGPMPEATMQLCNLLIKYPKSRDDLEEAADYLEMMIDGGTYVYVSVEPLDVEDVYDRLNICLEKLGRFDDALDRMLNLCKMKPDSHQIHFETGRLAILCKEYDLAREHLDFAVQLEPFDMFAKYHLALSHYHLGSTHDLQRAKDELLKIIQSKPNDEKCQNLLAKVHIAQNNWEDALTIYVQMNERKPNAYLEYQIAVVLENMQRDMESLQRFQNTVDLWRGYVDRIGYDKYFYNRPKEMRALQKIQSRCEAHIGDALWKELSDGVQAIGMNSH